ncbi:hypothetical protein [Bacillus sp. JCM 19034]|uniref:hypothetical protein n=1 Tax=Bacillus sp. JCM 19034 TaxID=1481928 RepID=UPI0007821B15|nr:hypothetical protein [Bacillus sp. JCM 19034]
MKRIIISIFSVGFILLFGMLFGIQLVSDELGMFQPVPMEMSISQTDNQEKDDIPYSELVDKANKAGNVGRFNFFSDLGESIANGLNHVSRACLSRMISFIHYLNGGTLG